MLKYRRELDGLRALAVISVLVYHAHIKLGDVLLFSGGFFGVDIFFVLSGYLITGIIKNSIDKNKFSFLDFYYRRAKRILPALFFILFITSILAYFILFPNELVEYAKSLKSSIYFASNHFFYNEDSYISESAKFKPLIHSWTLAVEWQFYIIYPLIFWFFYKYFKKQVFFLLLILLISSLSYSQYIVHKNPDFAFYLFPTRAWELIFGGILVFFEHGKFLKKNNDLKILRILPTIGIFLILYTLIFMDDKISHPSFITLIPVIGASIYILFTREGEFITNIFSTRILVFIGLISYSLYLWHQPVFVFLRLLKDIENMDLDRFLLAILISIILSYITYILIEKPLRKTKYKKISIPVTTIFILFCVIFSFTSIKSGGFVQRFGDSNLKSHLDMYEVVEFRRLSDKNNSKCINRKPLHACKFGDKSWVVVGDSMAGSFEYVLQEKLSKVNRGLISFSYEQCPFVNEDLWFGEITECNKINADRWSEILKFKNKKNFLISADYNLLSFPKVHNFNDNSEKIDPNIAWKSYVDNINQLIDMGHHVTVIYPMPAIKVNVKKKVLFQLRTNSKLTEVYYQHDNSYMEALEFSNKLDEYLKDRKNLHKIKPHEILCATRDGCIIIDKNGGYFNLNNHPSYIGAKTIIKDIKL